MTLNGRLYSENNTQHVAATSTVWSVLAEIPEDHIPDDGRVAFVVSGVVGRFTPSNYNLSTNPRAQYCAQVALAVLGSNGQVSTILTTYEHRVPLADTRYWEATAEGQAAGVPFQFLAVFDNSPAPPDPTFGTRWPTGGRLGLVAKIDPVSDPQTAGALFKVWDVSCVTWWPGVLGSTNYLCEHWTASGITNNGRFPSSPTLFQGGTNTMAAGTWLIHYAVEYWPAGPTGSAPLFRLLAGEQGSPLEAITGTQERFGLDARRFANVTSGALSRFWSGGFGSVVSAGLLFAGIEGGDHYPAPTQSTIVRRTRFFAVRVSELPNWRTDQEDLYVRVAGFPQTAGAFPFELQTPSRSVDWAVLYSAVVNPPRVMVPNQRTYWPLVDGTRNVFVFQSAGGVTMGNQIEGVPVNIAWSAPVGRTPNGQAPVGDRFLVRHWSLLDDYGDILDLADVNAAAFYFEDDPSNLPQDYVPPITLSYVAPETEATSIASLPALPTEPDAVRSVEQTMPESILGGEHGHLWGIPLLAKPARKHVLQVSGQTIAERDALLAFLRTNKRWRWTPPGSDALGFVTASRPTTVIESARTWTVRWEAWQIKYTAS